MLSVLLGLKSLNFSHEMVYTRRILQCNEFNRGHPRFIDQSEAELLTKNFDFVVFKNQSNSILKLTCMTEGRGRYKISSINILKRPHLFFRLCVQSTKLISHPINVFLDRQKYFSTGKKFLITFVCYGFPY